MKYYEIITEEAGSGSREIYWESEKILLRRWPWLTDVVTHDDFWEIFWCIGMTKIWVKTERI